MQQNSVRKEWERNEREDVRQENDGRVCLEVSAQRSPVSQQGSGAGMRISTLAADSRNRSQLSCSSPAPQLAAQPVTRQTSMRAPSAQTAINPERIMQSA